jgi:predicted nucleotidyltransferase
MRAKAGVTREEALRVAEACSRLLREQFGARAVYVCGSAVGEAPWHDRSDLDLVVEGLPAGRYFDALAAAWDLLPDGLDLDLLRIETAPPALVRRLRGEEKMPDDPKEALAQQIREELENLELLARRAETWLQGQREEPPPLEIMGAGKIVHDFYTGAERIFERIAVQVDDSLPSGLHWHTDLLRQMEGPWREKRGAVLDHGLALRLHRYMRFRHLFRHTYGYELVWDELRPLVESLSGALADLRARLATFL